MRAEPDDFSGSGLLEVLDRRRRRGGRLRTVRASRWPLLALVGGIAAIRIVLALSSQSSQPLSIDSVSAYQVPGSACWSKATLRGQILASGSGTATYHWILPDGRETPVRRISFSARQDVRDVSTRLVLAPSERQIMMTAILQVLRPDSVLAKASMIDYCPPPP